MLSFTLLLALAPTQVGPLQIDRFPGTPSDSLEARAACVGTATVPNYAGAFDFSLYPALIDCNAGSHSPWSGRYSPDGNHIYVTLYGGGLGASNCRVAKLDAQTLLPVSSIPVGLSPEEIAFVTRQGGALEYGFVTNSSGSSVTIFDAADQVVATVPIPIQPGNPFGTAFPFGLAVAPDQSRVYVGTIDGSGDIHVIDTATLSLVPAETISFGTNHCFGRLAFFEDTLVATVTVHHASFQGSTGVVAFVDPQNPQAAIEHVLASSPNGSAFPTSIDVAVWCDKVFVSGFDMGAQVFEFDGPTAELRATIGTETSNRMGKLHALGSDGKGLLIVADLFTGEVAWIDATRRTLVSVFDTGAVPEFHSQLNDVVVAPDGSRVLLTGLGSSTLAVFE
jgi:DNA-binding beta-propeller fold protein YncE